MVSSAKKEDLIKVGALSWGPLGRGLGGAAPLGPHSRGTHCSPSCPGTPPHWCPLLGTPHEGL